MNLNVKWNQIWLKCKMKLSVIWLVCNMKLNAIENNVWYETKYETQCETMQCKMN